VLLEGPIAPMLATPGRAMPEGDGWVLEPKWDGWRAVAHVTGEGARIFTRHGRGHHARFPGVNAALSELPAGTVLDGELVCLEPLAGGRVRSRFDRLSGFMLGRAPHRPVDGLTVTFVAFDVLAVDGTDLRALRWRERRAELERLLLCATGAVRLTPILDASRAVHDALVRDGWEGTVAKHGGGRDRCGRRTASWVKLKSAAAIERDRVAASLGRAA
jgi:bifunctional non-homologous end joining protein LigD